MYATVEIQQQKQQQQQNVFEYSLTFPILLWKSRRQIFVVFSVRLSFFTCKLLSLPI